MKYKVSYLDNNHIIKKEVEAINERTYEGRTYLYFNEAPFVCNKLIAEEVKIELSESVSTNSEIS